MLQQAFNKSTANVSAARIRTAKLPVLLKPVLPTDFQARVDALDEEIYKRGMAVSRDRLLSLGQRRFHELLAKDRSARGLQRVIGTKTDLTSWRSVEYAFGCANALTTSVPDRKTAEVNAGVGEDREGAAKVAGFTDLWKTTSEPESVRNVLAFHEAFGSLVLGISLLERLQSDGRVRSHSLCGASGLKAELFTDWLPTLTGAHFTVKLCDPLWHVLAWLSERKRRHRISISLDTSSACALRRRNNGPFAMRYGMDSFWGTLDGGCGITLVAPLEKRPT